ncbi:AzlD domain-containing protein [Vibrio sp. HN007]|uniref:AzlD domain-containing protein n=1 Tax=Vibrio iocasae TaxID=3098914 RepID=UPI0035D4F71C
MGESTWLALAIIAFGTFLMRVGPLFWMSRRIKRSENGNALAHVPVWLTVMGPVMIAAMFGTSLIPATPSILTWSATAVGAIFTLLAWYKTRTLGVPVLVGVVVYGVIVAFGG